MKNSIFLLGTRWFGVLGQSQILVRALRKKEIDVYIFGQEDKYYTQFETKNINFIKLRIKPSYFSLFSDLFDLLKILYYVKLKEPTAIHTFNPKPMIFGYVTTLFNKNLKLFIAQTGTGNLFERQKFLLPFLSTLIKKAHNRSNAVFFHNKYDSKLFLKKKLISKIKIIFIVPCIEVKKYLLKKKKKKKKIIIVICISRLLKQKGIIEFLGVADKFKKLYNKKKVEFLLVGEIERTHYDRVNGDLIRKAEKDRLIKRVIWSNNIKLLLQKSDILFLHSYREGGPRVIIEAAACELPTIGSNAIGVRDLIINNKTGIITKVGNINLAYRALKKLIDRDDLRKSYGKNALKLIAKPVSLEKATEKQLISYKKANIF